MSRERSQFIRGLYGSMIGDFVMIGRDHGYAMAVHGSLSTDLDIVAVPWTEDAATGDELLGAIMDELGLEVTAGCPGKKPHGRVAWSLVVGGGLWIDLSVMPLSAEDE